MVWEASKGPFGGVTSTLGPNSDLRFPGHWFQSESALHQNWMRDYDPTLGRYLQADPLGLVDGASVYGYALQNPGRYTDFFGLQTDQSSDNPNRSGESSCNCVCPIVPLHPEDVDIDQNIRDALERQHPWDLNWFYDQVKTGGPWDYKQRNISYENFGNFNYGATGVAMGIPYEILRRAAGAAQHSDGTTRVRTH